MSARPPAAVRLGPAQWRALASPVRQELVDALESAGPAPVARLAALLGRPADALYHHLRRLVRAGLVVECGRRQVGRHAFAEYDLARRPLRVDRTEAPARSVERVAAAAQRLAFRDWQRALRAGRGDGQGARRTLHSARARGWLGRADLARVNALLDELLDTLRAGRPGRARVPVSLAILLAPLEEGRRPRAARPARRTSRPRKEPRP